MDGDGHPALQYEAAMRDAHELLRRRDLGSYEETPLYFAWERLYAAQNKNLSVDFLLETATERLDREHARLPPRQGLPPPPRAAKKAEAWTTFDAPLRKSLLSSSFLRSGEMLSPASVDTIARKYRREAAEHRAARTESFLRSVLADDGARNPSSTRRKQSRKPRLKQTPELLLDAKKNTGRQTEVSPTYLDHGDAGDWHRSESEGEQEPIGTDEADGLSSPSREESTAKVAPIDAYFPSKVRHAASILATSAVMPRSSSSRTTLAVNHARLSDAFPGSKSQDEAANTMLHAMDPSAAKGNLTSALLSRLFQYADADTTSIRYTEFANASTSASQLAPQGSNPHHGASSRATGAVTMDPAVAVGGRRASRRHDGDITVDGVIDESDEWEEDGGEDTPVDVNADSRSHDRHYPAAVRDSSTARASMRDFEKQAMGRTSVVPRTDNDASSEDEAEDTRPSRRVPKRSELDEIVWPPGMDAAPPKFQYPDFGTFRPVGLESIKTEKEWREYWLWLHWYSSWQVWYLNNDAMHRRHRRTGRRGSEKQGRVSKKTSLHKPDAVSSDEVS